MGRTMKNQIWSDFVVWLVVWTNLISSRNQSKYSEGISEDVIIEWSDTVRKYVRHQKLRQWLTNKQGWMNEESSRYDLGDILQIFVC